MFSLSTPLSNHRKTNHQYRGLASLCHCLYPEPVGRSSWHTRRRRKEEEEKNKRKTSRPAATPATGTRTTSGLTKCCNHLPSRRRLVAHFTAAAALALCLRIHSYRRVRCIGSASWPSSNFGSGLLCRFAEFRPPPRPTGRASSGQHKFNASDNDERDDDGARTIMLTRNHNQKPEDLARRSLSLSRRSWSRMVSSCTLPSAVVPCAVVLFGRNGT